MKFECLICGVRCDNDGIMRAHLCSQHDHPAHNPAFGQPENGQRFERLIEACRMNGGVKRHPAWVKAMGYVSADMNKPLDQEGAAKVLKAGLPPQLADAIATILAEGWK